MQSAPRTAARDAVEIDGGAYSGSGTIVRQAIVYAAITGRAVHVVRARHRRPRPGLRHQHLCAVRAVRDVVGGSLEGAELGSQELLFVPGTKPPGARFSWDIGSAGSATALLVALVPLLATRSRAVPVEVRGSLFQDHAPTAFHVEHSLLHGATRMGVRAKLEIVRPGYVPRGGGILRLVLTPPAEGLRALPHGGDRHVVRFWGTSLASHLAERHVAGRMVAGARAVLAGAGHDARIEEVDDASAAQPGAAFALFADLANGARLGADGVGAPHRRAERIGATVARHLLDDLATGAEVDRYCADQLIPLAALARGETAVRIPEVTEHVESAIWLAREFTDVDVGVDEGVLRVSGRKRM